jgi:hypothetical protein
MDDALLVGVVNGLGQGLHQLGGVLRRVRRATQQVGQAAPSDVLQDQVRLRCVPLQARHLAELVEPHQVRVLQPRDGPRFLEKALALCGARQVSLAEQLDGDISAQSRLAGLEDHPHPTRTQHLEQLQAR